MINLENIIKLKNINTKWWCDYEV